MSKYEFLKIRMDNFIKAASRAKDNFMIAFWTFKANETKQRIEKLTLNEAMEEIKR